jgi:hypothetical protein
MGCRVGEVPSNCSDFVADSLASWPGLSCPPVCARFASRTLCIVCLHPGQSLQDVLDGTDPHQFASDPVAGSLA